VLNLADVADAARERLDPVHYDFFAGAACDERTMAANAAAFDSLRLLPRVLRGAGPPDLRTTLPGGTLSMPVFVAPTAFHRLAHPDGEAATASAAMAAGTVMVVSMASTQPIETIAAAARAATPAAGPDRGALWFQLYPQPDRAFTERIIRRAEAAGCTALVVTVDSPVLGRRERDLRHGFLDLPAGMHCANLREPGADRPRPIVMDPTMGWDTVDWLRETTTLPLVLKGILHPADARLAVGHGADAVMVSNHGGRQLDGAVATVEALPAVVDAVGGRVPVLLDGGVRRGTDVVAACALGASAVAVGRPVLWGLACGGAGGVRQVLDLLRAEVAQAMALCGAACHADLRPDLIHHGRSR
jgi:4-hydroxymandelate oxidase